MWSPEQARPAPDGSTAEETEEKTPPAKVITFVGVTDSRRRNLPDNAEPVVVRAPARRTFAAPPGEDEEKRRLSAESDELPSEQSTLSELIADTGEPASEYSTETATETDSSDSCSDPGEDYVADMYPARTSANIRSYDDKKRKGFKPTLPPAAVYKPPLTKRPKMSSITESRSSDEEATSDGDSERETISDQPLLATTIGRENNDAPGTSINQHVNERVEQENCDNDREILTGTPNSELAFSRAAGVHSECSEELPSRKETKTGRESDVTLSRSSSADDLEFEDAMEDLPHGRTEVKQEVIPANDVANVKKGPVLAIASSRALIRRGANFADAPQSKPLVSTEVKAEATGASPSIAAARATAKAASIATATASPHSPSSEDLHIYISTSCTIRSRAGPEDISVAVTRREADLAITDAHQLPRPPASDAGSEAPQRENIFSWLDSGDQVATTTHELPSPGADAAEMHTLESAAFQVLERHTRDSAEARRLAGQVVHEVARDRDLSAPSVYSPRPFSQKDRYSEMRRSLENLQRPKTSQAVRRADVRALRADPKAGSQFVEMSDVAVRKMPASPAGRVEATFISDSSGSTSPDDRSSQSKAASDRYHIRPEYRSVLQAPIDLSTNSYTRSALASSPTPIKGSLARRQDKRSEFFTANGEATSIGAIATAEMKLAALRSNSTNFEHSRPTSACSGLSAQQARLREVVDDDKLVQQQQQQRRRRNSCRNTDIDEAIRSSTRDLSALDAAGYDELGTAPGKFFSVSLYDLNAGVFSPPPEEAHNPAKTFFAATAKSLTSLLQTDIDTGSNAEEPLVVETDVDAFSRDSLSRPSKARSMVDLLAASPLTSPAPVSADPFLSRAQSMMLPAAGSERGGGLTLRERLELKAKSQTEMRIAKSLTKLHVPHWLDNVPMESERPGRQSRGGAPLSPLERPHSASSVPSLRRPVVIETRVLTPGVSTFPRSDKPAAPFQLPSQKFRNSVNEKLRPIRSKLRDSMPDLYTAASATEESVAPTKVDQLRSAPPLQPLRLDATDFAPKRTVRQVKREKTVETRTVQRSEVVLPGGEAAPAGRLADNGGSPDGGQSSPDSGYVGSRSWPTPAPGSVRVTETTMVEQTVRRDGVLEADRYRTATHEEWSGAADDDSLHRLVRDRFDLLPRLARSERPEERAYVQAVSDAVRFFGVAEPAAHEAKAPSLDDDELLAALTDRRRRGTDVAALLAGENNTGHSLLRAGIVSEHGGHFLQCARDQCRRRQPLEAARRSFTSCPACFTYYCGEPCAAWDRTAHLAHCAGSRLTSACQQIVRCVHDDPALRQPLVRLAHAGRAAFGRGFVLLTFDDLRDARRFLADADNDLTVAPCFVTIEEPAVAAVFAKAEASVRTACADYDPRKQFVIVVAVACKSSGRAVKKCATLPVGDDGAANDAVTPRSTTRLAAAPPAPTDQVPAGVQNGHDALKDSDGDTIDSSDDSETASSSESSSASSESGSETETEEETPAVKVKQEQAAREQRRLEEMRRQQEEEMKRRQQQEQETKRQEEEALKKKQQEEVRKREEELRKQQQQQEELRRQQQQQAELRRQQQREEELKRQQQQREEELRRQQQQQQQEEDSSSSSSGSETESTTDSDSDSSQSSEPEEGPAKPRPGMVIRARQMPPPVRSPGHNPAPRPVVRAAVAQSPVGSASSLGSHRGSVSSLRSDSSAPSSLDRPGRQALLAVSERKMLAHGVDLRRSFPELHAQLVRFVEQNQPFPRRTVYPSDARTGRRLACTFVCGREPIIQVVPQSSSSSSSPRDTNFNVQLKKSTVETEL